MTTPTAESRNNSNGNKYLALILLGVAASVLVYLALPVFGILLFAAALMGVVIELLPRTWKVSTKMALRNIGRQRTTTTMLALFIGVFTVGLVLALGQDLQAQISSAFAQNLTYNVVTITSGTDTLSLPPGSLPYKRSWEQFPASQRLVQIHILRQCQLLSMDDHCNKCCQQAVTASRH